MRQPSPYRHLASVYLLERFAYYSVRSLFILSLLQTFRFSQAEASQLFGYMTLFTVFSPIIGGAIVDIFRRKDRSLPLICVTILVGAGLMGLSVMTKSIALLYIGLIVFSLGEIMFRPTLYAQVSYLYENKSSYDLGAGFLLLSVAASVGGFFAPIVAGSVDQKMMTGAGFLIAALAIGLGFVMIKNLPAADRTDDKIKTNYKSIFVLLVAVASPYGLLSGLASLKLEQLTTEMSGFLAFVPTVVGIVAAVFLSTYWSRKAIYQTVSITKRFLIGSALGLVATIAIFGLIWAKGSVTNQRLSTFTLLPSLLLAVAESFITPLAIAYVARTSSIRFRALIIGGWFTAVQVIELPVSYLQGYLGSSTAWALAGAAVLFVVCTFYVDRKISN